MSDFAAESQQFLQKRDHVAIKQGQNEYDKNEKERTESLDVSPNFSLQRQIKSQSQEKESEKITKESTAQKDLFISEDEISHNKKCSDAEQISHVNGKYEYQKQIIRRINRKRRHIFLNETRSDRRGKRNKRIRKKFRECFGNYPNTSESEEEYTILKMSYQRKGQQKSPIVDVCIKNPSVLHEIEQEKITDTSKKDETSECKYNIDISNNNSYEDMDKLNPIKTEHINKQDILSIDTKDSISKNNTSIESNEKNELYMIKANMEQDINQKDTQMNLCQNIEKQIEIAHSEAKTTDISNAVTPNLQNDQQLCDSLLSVNNDKIEKDIPTKIINNTLAPISKGHIIENKKCTVNEAVNELSMDNEDVNDIEIEIRIKPGLSSRCTNFHLKTPLSSTNISSVDILKNNSNFQKFCDLFKINPQMPYHVTTHGNTIRIDEDTMSEKSRDVNENIKEDVVTILNLKKTECNSNQITKDSTNNFIEQKDFKDHTTLDKDKETIKYDHINEHEDVKSVEQKTIQISNEDNAKPIDLTCSKELSSKISTDNTGERNKKLNAYFPLNIQSNVNNTSSIPYIASRSASESPSSSRNTFITESALSPIIDLFCDKEYIVKLKESVLGNICRNLKYCRYYVAQNMINDFLKGSRMHIIQELERFGKALHTRNYGGVLRYIVAELNKYALEDQPTSFRELSSYAPICLSKYYNSINNFDKSQFPQNIDNVPYLKHPTSNLHTHHSGNISRYWTESYDSLSSMQVPNVREQQFSRNVSTITNIPQSNILIPNQQRSLENENNVPQMPYSNLLQNINQQQLQKHWLDNTSNSTHHTHVLLKNTSNNQLSSYNVSNTLKNVPNVNICTSSLTGDKYRFVTPNRTLMQTKNTAVIAYDTNVHQRNQIRFQPPPQNIPLATDKNVYNIIGNCVVMNTAANNASINQQMQIPQIAIQQTQFCTAPVCTSVNQHNQYFSDTLVQGTIPNTAVATSQYTQIPATYNILQRSVDGMPIKNSTQQNSNIAYSKSQQKPTKDPMNIAKNKCSLNPSNNKRRRTMPKSTGLQLDVHQGILSTQNTSRNSHGTVLKTSMSQRENIPQNAIQNVNAIVTQSSSYLTQINNINLENFTDLQKIMFYKHLQQYLKICTKHWEHSLTQLELRNWQLERKMLYNLCEYVRKCIFKIFLDYRYRNILTNKVKENIAQTIVTRSPAIQVTQTCLDKLTEQVNQIISYNLTNDKTSEGKRQPLKNNIDRNIPINTKAKVADGDLSMKIQGTGPTTLETLENNTNYQSSFNKLQNTSQDKAQDATKLNKESEVKYDTVQNSNTSLLRILLSDINENDYTSSNTAKQNEETCNMKDNIPNKNPENEIQNDTGISIEELEIDSTKTQSHDCVRTSHTSASILLNDTPLISIKKEYEFVETSEVDIKENSNYEYLNVEQDISINKSTNNCVEEMRNNMKEKRDIDTQSPIEKSSSDLQQNECDDIDISFMKKEEVDILQDISIDPTNNNEPQETLSLNLKHDTSTTAMQYTKLNEQSLLEADTIEQYKDIEEEKIKIDIDYNIYLSDSECHTAMQSSPCDFIDNNHTNTNNISNTDSITCTSMKTEDRDVIVPNILNVRSISQSLFDKINTIDLVTQDDSRSFTDTKEIELSNIDSNMAILDELDNKTCLRCNRKSTVLCENCLKAHYCSKRCSDLHWKADHHKHCKSYNNYLCTLTM